MYYNNIICNIYILFSTTPRKMRRTRSQMSMSSLGSTPNSTLSPK